MIRIVFTGPECSGKTTLSNSIAKKFQLPLITEYAREYLTNLNRDYNYSDLLQIAKGQLLLEQKKLNDRKKNKAIISDTNLQVIKIWSLKKYSKCHSFILKNQDLDAYYILCCPDFNWKYDPLRESRYERMDLFKTYQKDLIKTNQKFIIAKGSHEQRMTYVSSEIIKMI